MAKADVLLWGGLQTGAWGNQDHRAYGFAAEAGYQLKNVKWQPWLRAGYWRGSGDDDPADGDHKTFFQVLPTPRQYARFPFYNLMNNEDIFAQLILKPTSKLTLRTEAHRLRLSDSADLWYSRAARFKIPPSAMPGGPVAATGAWPPYLISVLITPFRYEHRSRFIWPRRTVRA